MRLRAPAVYIMASRRNGTLYTGVTSDLARRAYEHREGILPGFTLRYGCKLLVFYEFHADMPTAIGREKQIKGGSRKNKWLLLDFGVMGFQRALPFGGVRGEALKKLTVLGLRPRPRKRAMPF